MGTRSIIAVPQGDVWQGRYCHWDGYPTSHGPTLFELVRRHGLETVQCTLTELHYGWSTLNLAQPDGWTQYQDAYQDGRFVAVEGWGVAYTEKDNQSGPNDWIMPDGDKWGTEWAYVLTSGGLMVGKVGYVRGEAPDPIEWINIFPWDNEPNWEIVECGEHFERCPHIASYHDENAPDDTGMTEWYRPRLDSDTRPPRSN